MRERVSQIVLDRIKAEIADQEPITISSADPITPETADKRRRFRQAVNERASKLKSGVEEMMAELSGGGREWVFSTILARLWMSAQWAQTNQFRNGKPLGKQFGPELNVIYQLVEGIGRWQSKQMSDGPNGADEDFAYHTPGVSDDAGSPHNSIG